MLVTNTIYMFPGITVFTSTANKIYSETNFGLLYYFDPS